MAFPSTANLAKTEAAAAQRPADTAKTEADIEIFKREIQKGDSKRRSKGEIQREFAGLSSPLEKAKLRFFAKKEGFFNKEKALPISNRILSFLGLREDDTQTNNQIKQTFLQVWAPIRS